MVRPLRLLCWAVLCLASATQAALPTQWRTVDVENNTTIAVSEAHWHANQGAQWRVALVRFAPLMAGLSAGEGANQPQYIEMAARCKYQRLLALAQGTTPDSRETNLWDKRALAASEWDKQALTISDTSRKNRLIFEAICGQEMPPVKGGAGNTVQ